MATILFIDPTIPDYQSLTSGLTEGTQLVILDPNQDGVSQITAALQGSKFDAVHIVSHGTVGDLQLGTAQLNSSTIQTTYSNLIQQWSNSLNPGADILLYGCNVAQGDVGKNFVQQLHQLTGADIAASDNATGSVVLGGDWNLEYTTGNIEAPLAFQVGVLQAYNSVLAPFAPGDIVVLQAGDGNAALSGSATAVFLKEYNTSDSTPVQSIALPTTVSSSNRILTQSGSAASEGALSLSSDGRYLTLVGYDAPLGTASVGSTASATINRIVARVDAFGTVDTSTKLNNAYSGNNIRSAVTTDGSGFWVAGTTSTALSYVTFGSTGASTILSGMNSHVVEIFNGQLYTSLSSSSINTVGTGLPTSGSPTVTPLPGLPNTGNPYAYVLLDRDASVAGADTLYIADQTSGLFKYSFNGTTWTAEGSITGFLTGLTGVVHGNGVDLYATKGTGSANTLVKFTDSAAYNAILSGSFTTLATASTNTSFKGVAFAPTNNLPDLTIAVVAPNTPGVNSQFTYTLTAANTGTANASGVVVQFTLPSGASYVSASGFSGGTINQSGSLVTFSGGSINANTSSTLTVTVTAPNPGSVTLPIGAAFIDLSNNVIESNELNNYSTASITTSNLPDLTVGVSAPSIVTTGVPFNYTFTAANTGTANASGVAVQFTLPSGVSYVSASGFSGGTVNQSGSVVTFTGGSINANTSSTLTVTVTDTVTGSLAGSVTLPTAAAVIDPSNAVFEGNESNNSSPGAVTTTVKLYPAPQANADSYTVNADTPLTVSAAQGLLANDSGSPLTFIKYSTPSHGTIALNPDGSFTYTPQTSYTGADSFTYTVSDAVQLYKTNLPPLATFNGVNITSGGYGSSLAVVPGSTDEFYGITDRGPNVDGPNGTKVEPIPSFTPAIGKFKFVNGQAILEQSITLKAADGTPYSGRVNSQNSTGETITDLNGNVLAPDVNGYDPEGLAALSDGTFWVSDEYGPFITHFDATGKQIGRLSPFDGTLPAELQDRIANRGLEGLTITPDGSTLVAMMQSALQEPDIGSANAKNIAPLRIVTYTIATGAIHEYLYLLDNPSLNGTAVSEITALSNTQFLVDERDGNYDPGAYKKLWQIDISGATDIGPSSTVAGATYNADRTKGALGLLIGGKSIEAVVGTQNTSTSSATLSTDGITTVSKTLKLDVGSLLTTLDPQGTFFSHDKIEGVSVLNGGNQIVLSNDSDFGIGGATATTANAPYTLQAKTSPVTGQQDDGEYLSIDLTKLPAQISTATVSLSVINHTATITGTATAAVTEDTSSPNLTTIGSLTVNDVDAGQNIFNTTVTSATDNLGSLSITNAGVYSYSVANSAVQFLGAGQTKAETFTVKSVDGTASQNIIVTINGVNDVPTIIGTTTASVTEDTTTPNLTATGFLTINDVDAGESLFNTTVTSATDNLGSLSITNSGVYSYSVANSAVQFLGAGQTKAETFTVKSVDGTASQNIIVTINGVNDAPTVANAVPDQTTTENSAFNFTVPTNTFADVDAGDTLTYTATLDNGNALPSWLSFNANTETFSGTPLAANVGTIGVQVKARDNSNASVSDIFNLSVSPLNLTGTPNADILTGTDSNNTINGLAGNDILIGGAGNDILIGGAGNDLLVGGTGADQFLYNTSAPFATSAVGVDTIYDFNHSQGDQIVLSKNTFNGITSNAGTGFSNASDFKVININLLGLTLLEGISSAPIVYDAVNGRLFYNQNGTAPGFGSGGQFATLTGAPTLTANDFIVQG